MDVKVLAVLTQNALAEYVGEIAYCTADLEGPGLKAGPNEAQVDTRSGN